MIKMFSLVTATVVALVLLGSCQPEPPGFSSDFYRGGGQLTEQPNDSTLIIRPEHWKKNDGIGDQYYWFYFALGGAADRQLNFVLKDLIGTYRGNPHLIYSELTQPVFSYDRQHWQRIEDVRYQAEDSSFSFSHTFREDSVWIAYAHPYGQWRLDQLIEEYSYQPLFRAQSIGQSRMGRDINLFSLGRATRTDDGRNVLILSLQHPGEDAGGYFSEGMIRYLMDTEDGRRLLTEYTFHFVPIVNPDGMAEGITRYNHAHEDLNNIWRDSTKKEPEVLAVQQWVDRYYATGNSLDLFFDVHCWGQQSHGTLLINAEDNLRELYTAFTQAHPARIGMNERDQHATTYFRKKYQVPSTLIELAQSYAEDSSSYFTISDYQNMGAEMAKAIANYWE